MLSRFLAFNFSNLFQSAPGREAGRCTMCLCQRLGLLLFQSAPGREAGRC